MIRLHRLTGRPPWPCTTLLGMLDKHYYGRAFEHALTGSGLRLLRKASKGEPARAGTELFKPLRQTVESINQTLKGQLDLERHGGRTPAASSSV